MRHLKKINEWSTGFGQNSKVSENGKLVTVYHGTNASFDKFDASYMGQTDEGYYGRGFYFTIDRDEAKDYGNRIIEAKLDVKNPFYLRTWSTLGSYQELYLRDDLSKLKGVPDNFKIDKSIPKGYYLKREEGEHGSDKTVTYSVHPKPELYGTDKEVYGPDVTVTEDEAKRPGSEEGYSLLAIVQFNDMQNNNDFDGGLANWVLQKLDRYNFHELLQKNGYDGIFVVGDEGDKTPIDEVSEIVVWDPSQIQIIK